MTCDRGHVTGDRFVFLLVSVLLSAHIERFSVSHMKICCTVNTVQYRGTSQQSCSTSVDSSGGGSQGESDKSKKQLIYHHNWNTIKKTSWCGPDMADMSMTL